MTKDEVKVGVVFKCDYCNSLHKIISTDTDGAIFSTGFASNDRLTWAGFINNCHTVSSLEITIYNEHF